MKKGALITLIVTVVIFVAATVASIILFVNAGASDFKSYSEDVQKIDVSEKDSAELKSQDVIKLEEIACKAVVKQYDGSSVKAELTGSFSGRIEPDVKVKSTSREITVSMSKSDMVSGWFGINRLSENNLTLTVYIPKKFDGDFEIEDCAGYVTSEIDFKSIKIENCAGKIEVKGAFDTVYIKDCAGSISAETTDSSFDSIEVKDCAGKTEITVPKNAKGTIEAKDCVGGVSSDFDLTKDKDELFNYSGEMNGGGNSEISIKDCVGGVNIKKAK